jgi:hypothetical protein
MIDGFTAEMFAEQVNTKFRMRLPASDDTELELVSVRDLGSSARHSQFSVMFLAPGTAPIEQRIYRLEHDKLGTLELFLVPVGKDSSGVHYEAVFSRTL